MFHAFFASENFAIPLNSPIEPPGNVVRAWSLSGSITTTAHDTLLEQLPRVISNVGTADYSSRVSEGVSTNPPTDRTVTTDDMLRQAAAWDLAVTSWAALAAPRPSRGRLKADVARTLALPPRLMPVSQE